MVNVRYTYANDPIVYHANGLMIGKKWLPTTNTLKFFINGILSKVFVTVNPPKGHKRCSSLCGQPVQIIIGWPHSSDAASSVPSEVKQLVHNLEDMLKKITFGGEEEVAMQTLAVRFLPCPRHIEILQAAIYLL